MGYVVKSLLSGFQFYGRSPSNPWNVWKQRSEQDHVDIITFYNKIFVPAVKPLLVELGPAGTAMKTNRVSEVNHNNDGIHFQPLLMILTVSLLLFCKPSPSKFEFFFTYLIRSMPWIA